MGGFGSGKRSERLTVEGCVRFSLAQLKAWGMLQMHTMRREHRIWSAYEKTIASLAITADINCLEPHPCLHIRGAAYGRAIDHRVLLDAEPMRFGGARWFALCPSTGKRCTTLVLVPGKAVFISRAATGLPNITQRMDRVARAQWAVDRAERLYRELPKYARHSTRDRLIERICWNQEIVDNEIERLSAHLHFLDRGR